MKIETIFFENIQKEIEYIIGNNKTENFEIIDNSQPDDVWIHANNVPSCHVIVKIGKDKIDRKEFKKLIKRGALLCRQYTNKIKNDNNVSEFVFTRVKNVKKTDVIGQVTLLEQTIITL
jgi:predicted ribosome quality control (RQC) complex YloA/Tae2 family protein